MPVLSPTSSSTSCWCGFSPICTRSPRRFASSTVTPARGSTICPAKKRNAPVAARTRLRFAGLSLVLDGVSHHALMLTVPAVLGDMDIRPLYFELDGTFPNHEANPLDPKNLVDLQKFTVEQGADIGLAFDGDADRCFVVDERGEAVSPSAITALRNPPGFTVDRFSAATSRLAPTTPLCGLK